MAVISDDGPVRVCACVCVCALASHDIRLYCKIKLRENASDTFIGGDLAPNLGGRKKFTAKFILE